MENIKNISSEYLKWFVDNSLKEDVGSGDHTSNACITKDSVSKAKLLVKDHGIIAGIDLAKMILTP